MKKIFLILALGAMVASCSPDNNGGTEGDGKTRVTLTFEGDYWNSLIDNAQYNGDLLYKQEGYSWYDEATDLSHSVNGGKYGSYFQRQWFPRKPLQGEATCPSSLPLFLKLSIDICTVEPTEVLCLTRHPPLYHMPVEILCKLLVPEWKSCLHCAEF